MKPARATPEAVSAARPIAGARRRLTAFGLAAAVATGSACGGRTADRGATATDEGPIVIFLVDTLRPDRVGVYGAPRPTTPVLDEMARAAVVYENAYAHSSWTRPSVATLLTSLSPSASGAVGRYGLLRPTVPYLPDMASRAGWETAAFLSNANVYDERLGFQRGFDVFHAAKSEKPLAGEIVDPAIEWVRSRGSGKFLLFVHLLDPHMPYRYEPGFERLFPALPGEPPDSEREARLREYDRTIRQADRAFGALAAALEARGFWDSATVVFTSDHGEEFGEHGAYGHGWTLFEEAVRVPLVVKYPRGSVPPGRQKAVVTLADVAITLASVAGLAAQDLAGAPGSLGSDLRRPRPDRAVFFAQDLDEFRLAALRRGSAKVVEVLQPIPGRAVYDLAEDRGEHRGSAAGCGTPPAAPKGLVEELERLWLAEIERYPRIEIRSRPGQSVRVGLRSDLGDVPKAFLTFRDVCDIGPTIRSGRLDLRREVAANEAFVLTLAARDDGTFPAVRWDAKSGTGEPLSVATSDARVRVEKRAEPRITGPTTDEVLANLRALGYLGTQAPPRAGASAPAGPLPTASAPP